MRGTRRMAPQLRWLGVVMLVAGALAGGLAAAEDEKATVRREPVGEEVAATKIGKKAVEWLPKVEYARLHLRVAGPDGAWERTFEPGTNPSFALRDQDGTPLADGRYRYELTVVPKLDEKTRERLAEAQEAGVRGLTHGPRQLGLVPRGPSSQSGSFSVRRGEPVDPDEEEPGAIHGKPTDPKVKVGGDMTIWGDLSVRGTKSFATLDPEDPARAIYFGVLEGPEVGTYYRGSAKLADGEAVLELPDYFAKLTEERGLTVQLTPLGGWSRLYVAEKSLRRLVVRQAAGDPDVAFDFLVQGVRKGYADFQVVRDPKAEPLAFPEAQ